MSKNRLMYEESSDVRKNSTWNATAEFDGQPGFTRQSRPLFSGRADRSVAIEPQLPHSQFARPQKSPLSLSVSSGLEVLYLFVHFLFFYYVLVGHL